MSPDPRRIPRWRLTAAEKDGTVAGMIGFRRLALVLVLIAAVPATAAEARTTIAYPAGATSLTLANSADPVLDLSMDTFRAANCVPPFCVDRFVVSSPQKFTESPATGQCAPVDGVTDDSAFACSAPVPVRVTVTGTAGADAIRATGSGAGACPPVPVTVRGGGAADVILGTCADDDLDGGDGDDSISASGGANTVAGGSGSDTLTAGAGADGIAGGLGDDDIAGAGGNDTLDGGDGDDALDAGEGDDAVAGGTGRDRLLGASGADALDGGDGNDELESGDGNDVLRGGAGRDLLLPGAGTDSVQGGDDFDTVSYEERTGPVTVTLDGVADDGEAGEFDAVGADVENAFTGAGADALRGGAGPSVLEAGAGNDVVDGQAGPDLLDAGPGDDLVLARDGEPDRVDCGAGADSVSADVIDVLVNCEAVDASRALLSDVDNDGVPAPADCNDGNAAQRPGLPDRPGDGLDADCRGGDARFPRVLTAVQTRWRLFATHAQFVRLILLDVPPDATVELRCKGGGCFKRTKRIAVPNGAGKRALTSLVRKLELRPKAMLEVRILRPDTIGKVVRYTVRKGKAPPQSRILCLRPGTKRPRGC